MGMTIIEKILARGSGAQHVAPGDLVVVKVDVVAMIDPNFVLSTWPDLQKVHDPDKIVVIYDHRVPAPDARFAKAHQVGREFVKKFGIKRFHDVGANSGICHVILTENAYALPGSIVLCSDSHTCSSGAWNCAARGVGAPDIMYSAATGTTWFRVGETIRYDLVGKLNEGVTTKDVFLYLAQTYGGHENQNIEFGGPALRDLSLNARRTLSTMGAELSAEFATFEPDDILIDYVRNRTSAPFEPVYPDADANYLERRTIDLSTIEPMVALPDSMINNTVPLSAVKDVAISQAFLGSCANGSLDDIAIAAGVAKGKRVSDGVRFIITPGSQEIYRDAVKAGYVDTLLDAGALFTNATCGACGGGGLGVLGPDDVCITASTRNFKGRMGDPSAKIYMGSPATVAASAIAGVITHPGKIKMENLA